jgi:hypothetical protein
MKGQVGVDLLRAFQWYQEHGKSCYDVDLCQQGLLDD